MAERTITAYTFSKTYAMTGWRAGYAVAKEPFMTGLRKLVLYSTNGVSTPTQWAALEAMAIPQETIAARCEEYRQRRDLLVTGLNELGLACDLPAGAFYAFPAVTKIHKDSRRVAMWLRFPASSLALRAKDMCVSAMPFPPMPSAPGWKRCARSSTSRRWCTIVAFSE
jgi:aspartate aminotransferase